MSAETAYRGLLAFGHSVSRSEQDDERIPRRRPDTSMRLDETGVVPRM